MRALNIPALSFVLLSACASYIVDGTTSPTVARWEARDIEELIATIGPYDTTSVKGDYRSYDWFRFGRCHLAAHTSLEGKIQKVALEGTGMGCDVYLQKLGAT
jgi:hypothetical protein